MAKTKSAQAQSEAALIRACVVYAQTDAAFNGGFRADPDGNSKTAERLGSDYEKTRDNALDKITKMSATSNVGLDAKRRIAKIIMNDVIHGRNGGIENNELHFLESFIIDVENYLENEYLKEQLAKAA